MTILEQNTCSIQLLNNKGLGVGYTNQGTVELPFTLPGEIVKFTRHHYRGKSNCTLDEMVTSSPNRIIPICKYFSRCGGCLLQHFDKNTYKDFKYNLVRNELTRANISTQIKPLFIIDDQRRRVNLQFVKKEEQIYLGYHRFHSHQIININSCPAAAHEISKLIIPLKKILSEILTSDHKGQIFITKAANGIELMIEFKDMNSAKQNELVNFAKENTLIKLSIKDSESQKIIYQSEVSYVEFSDVKVEINYASFLQASFAADKILANLVTQYLPTKNNLNILDLFCGRGTFSFILNKHGAVDGFEIDQLAISSASRAAQSHKLTSINFLLRNLFTNPLQGSELNNYNFAIINPPRKGALEQCAFLAESNIRAIIYVSCDIQSFTRDALILIKGGYNLKEVTPIDQFYWTPHLEIIGFFIKV